MEILSNEQLAMRYQRGDRESLTALWAQAARLAKSFTRKYWCLVWRDAAVDIEDLFQCAFLAVERAARGFSGGVGAFSTLLEYCVRNECQRALGLRGRVRRERYDAVSIDAPLGDGSATLADTLEDNNRPDEDEAILTGELRQMLETAFDRLKPCEAAIVRSSALAGAPMADVAAALGERLDRAYNIRHRAMLKLQRDWRLRRLYDEAFCWRHKGVGAFNNTWSSVVEDAVVQWDT
jgi:RNA polymerase sigma factor (sigma-70 family)